MKYVMDWRELLEWLDSSLPGEAAETATIVHHNKMEVPIEGGDLHLSLPYLDRGGAVQIGAAPTEVVQQIPSISPSLETMHLALSKPGHNHIRMALAILTISYGQERK